MPGVAKKKEGLHMLLDSAMWTTSKIKMWNRCTALELISHNFREYIDESSVLYYIWARENLEDDRIQYELILNFLSTNLPPPPQRVFFFFAKFFVFLKPQGKMGDVGGRGKSLKKITRFFLRQFKTVRCEQQGGVIR